MERYVTTQTSTMKTDNVIMSKILLFIIAAMMKIRLGNTSYDAIDNCIALQPSKCDVIPDKDQNGKATYTSYLEACSKHICTQIRPISPPPPPLWPPPYHSPGSQSPPHSTSPWTPVLNISSSPPPPSSGTTIHASTKNLQVQTHTAVLQSYGITQDNPWFCGGFMLNYTTRVEANTGFPPGYKEDAFARCHFMRLLDLQSLGDCRHLRYSCKDCQTYYQNWLCALAFPRCLNSEGNGNLTTFQRVDMPMTNDIKENTIIMMKPCRALCFGVLQACQAFLNFNCPETDGRDYGDYPHCNTLGLENKGQTYVTSIYR